jgi:protein SCO1/2
MEISNNRLVSIFIALAVIGGTFFFSKALQSNNFGPEFATVWPRSVAIPEIELIDHDGQSFKRENLTGSWQLMFFGFTHCPDICPATLQQLSLVQASLEEIGKVAPEILLVTVDPERDTPDVLATYISYFDANIKGITGDLDEIRKLTSTSSIFFEKSYQGKDEYTVDHSTVILIINESGAIQASFSAPHVISNFVKDLPRITGSK